MVDLRGGTERELVELPSHRFVDCERVGRTANAEVFRAWDKHLEREVALKVARDTPAAPLAAPPALPVEEEQGIREGVRRLAEQLGEVCATDPHTLVREARLLARVDHPNVVAVLDMGRLEEGAVGVVTPYLAGGSLASRELEGPWHRTLEIALAIGEGLAAIHAAGLLCGDLRPGVVRFDSEGRPRIAELGLARRPDDALALSDWVGDEDYAAPEVLAHEGRDCRSDIYAYCVMVFELFYGHPPYASASARERGELTRSQHEGELPGGLRDILARGLEPDPAQRWADMPSLLRVLARVGNPRPRRWSTVALSAVAVASVGIGLFIATDPARADVCDDPLYELASMWTVETRDELRGALGTRKVGDAMESWVSRWVAVRGQECERAQQADIEPRASACTSAARERFEATLHAFSTPHLREGLNYASVIAELPAPEHCLEHPDDAPQGDGAGLLELRDEEMRAEVSIKIGDLVAARAAQADYMRMAQNLNSDYGFARALYWRGEIRRLERDYAGASEDFELALERAHRLGAELFAAEAHMRMMVLAGEQGELAGVRANAVAARTMLSVHQPDRVAELMRLEGLALFDAPDQPTRAEGLDKLARAVEMREDQLGRYGGTREPLSQAHESYAKGLLTFERPLDALEYIDRALDAHQEEFGHGTWRKHDLLCLRFEALLELDRFESAKDVHNQIQVITVADDDWQQLYTDTLWMIALYRAHGHDYWATVTAAGNQKLLQGANADIAQIEELEAILVELGH